MDESPPAVSGALRDGASAASHAQGSAACSAAEGHRSTREAGSGASDAGGGAAIAAAGEVARERAAARDVGGFRFGGHALADGGCIHRPYSHRVLAAAGHGNFG